jgi:two-component system OmpR family response regulator
MGFSYKILIVDDEEPVSNFMVSLFSKYGHSCETAKDGIEALEIIKKNSFDSAVIDIVMPLMDGITLTRELVNLHPDLPIMVMTGHADEHSAESAIAAGAREFINKPFSLPEFIIRFDKMMRDHETLCKMKEKYSKMLFNLQRNSSEEIERLKGQIKTNGGQWSYFYDPND